MGVDGKVSSGPSRKTVFGPKPDIEGPLAIP
jgi:hypothetical protein